METSTSPAPPRRGKLTQSQREAIAKLRVPGDADVPNLDDKRPASIYTDRDHFELEQRKIFKKVPVPITLSAQLHEPGMAMAADGYGIPLLVTRDRDGGAHVFLNGCRHRGSRLLEGCAALKSARVTCPYHAWTFDLKGKLIGIPRPEAFPSVNKGELGLVELTSYESGGVIWACLDHKASAQLVPGTEQFAADMAAFELADMHVYARQSFDLAANWKLVYEPFLEGYHVQRLHAQSIANLFVDVAPVIRRLGSHIAQTSGNANYYPELKHVDDVDIINRHITHTYQLFPNLIFIASPYYISIMILMPRSEGRTVVDYYMLVKSAPDSEKAHDVYARSFKLAMDVFGGEDFRAATLQQEALAPGMIPEVYYGGLEEALIPFHENIESYLTA